MKVRFFRFPRSEGTSDIPHILRIDTLTERLERARQIVAKGQISAAPNREGHYIVGADHDSGFYVVNAQGCCNDSPEDIDLLHGYCEHRLAADLYKESQGLTTDIISQPEFEELEDRITDDTTYVLEEPPVSKPTRKAQSTRSRKNATNGFAKKADRPQPVDNLPMAALNGHSTDQETTGG